MTPFSPESFVAMIALIGAVIIVSALLSGLVERSGLPQVAVFLAIGVLIGPTGLGLLDADVDSLILRVVATLSLVLVLFTDAVSLDMAAVRGHRLLALLVLGPGTFASAALIALAAWWLLDLSPALAAILGAALASTDPVLLRGLLRRPELHSSVRQALRLESGLNDAALLPIVLLAMTFLGSVSVETSRAKLVVTTFLLSPTVGVVIGFVAIAALKLMKRRMGVRRDYESLYSLGVAFAAFAATEAIHGSGFLAAFAAGLTIAALDVELCDCFLEYGETTAEMALLFTFVLLGTSLIWTGFRVVNLSTLLFTGAVLLARPLAFLPALFFAPAVSWGNRILIAWFGPRGLSSLLLVLLPVFAGISSAEQLVPVCCLVVLVSITIHGFSPMFLVREKPVNASGQIVQASEQGDGDIGPDIVRLSHSEYIDVADLRALQQTGATFAIVDARTERTFNESEFLAQGAARISPDRAVLDAHAMKLPQTAVIAVFCA